uniref:Uncharacterized protein n=1 Tax=Phenylobacterium glaciei TaxID=2803784 RepID=A0A974P434_9CAUL|nr:hypothetical protein JKL49_00920 [Phenylobacterium glaciei]
MGKIAMAPTPGQGLCGGSFQLPINVAYNLLVDQGGGAAQYGGRGGGYSGIRRVSDGKSVLIAGGGGSDGYGPARHQRRGRGSVGQNGTADTSGNDRGYGGSQSAGGSGGGAGGGLYAASGSWGRPIKGRRRLFRGAGGGGYFGGGGGAGSDYAGASGGGGSGYFDPALVLDGQLIGAQARRRAMPPTQTERRPETPTWGLAGCCSSRATWRAPPPGFVSLLNIYGRF